MGFELLISIGYSLDNFALIFIQVSRSSVATVVLEHGGTGYHIYVSVEDNDCGNVTNNVAELILSIIELFLQVF